MTFEKFCETEIAPLKLLNVTQPNGVQFLRKAYEAGQQDIILKLKNGDMPGFKIIETE